MRILFSWPLHRRPQAHQDTTLSDCSAPSLVQFRRDFPFIRFPVIPLPITFRSSPDRSRATEHPTGRHHPIDSHADQSCLPAWASDRAPTSLDRSSEQHRSLWRDHRLQNIRAAIPRRAVAAWPQRVHGSQSVMAAPILTMNIAPTIPIRCSSACLPGSVVPIREGRRSEGLRRVNLPAPQ